MFPSGSRRNFLATGVSAAAWALQPAFSATSELTALTIRKAAEMLRSKAVSPVELTEACLKRIDQLNPKLNAYITIMHQQAVTQAREMQEEQRRGKWRGPLHGIPIALKDNIDTAGVRTTGASEVFKDRVPGEDAEVARRLKNAGAILLGKLNLHEFAYGGSSNVTFFGTIHNPWAPDRTTGGSSGGPGAGVSADLCFGALGTDTAGSVRIPASYCGIVGLKPTYGRVSLRGVIPLSWTLDHVGPMCKTVEDAALMLGIIAGYDPADPTTVDVAVADYTRVLKTPTAKLRVGIPRSPFYDSLDPEVSKAVETALETVRNITASAKDVKLPPGGNPAQLWTPEAYVYHAKWIAESPQKYQPSTRAALQRGADFKADVYIRARNEVERLRREIRTVFADVDVLVTPTMPTPAPPIEGGGPGGGARNTSPFDVYGIPTISIPCGFTAAGLPIGLQISAAPWAESSVFALANAFEQGTDWHTRRPRL